MKRLSEEHDELKVVADQFGVPTSNQFISEQIQHIIPQLNKNNAGIYHLVPDDSCSWYDFAKKIISQTNHDFNFNNLHAIASHEFPSKIKRPKNSVLSNQKIKDTFGLNIKYWQEYLNEIVL